MGTLANSEDLDFHQGLHYLLRKDRKKYNTFWNLQHVTRLYRVNPGKYGQGGKYGHMTYNSHVQEHRSVTKECFIPALNSIYSALLHPYTT